MLNMFAGEVLPITAFIGVFFAFSATCILTSFLNDWLPRDHGREFAHNGKLSAGKPRGAGIIFISVFCIAALLFGEMSVEMFIYLVLVFIEMLTGFLDDAAEVPWGELKKGILDFLVAAVAALNYMHFNSTYVELATIGVKFYIPPVLFFIVCILGYLWYNATPSRLMMGDAGSRAMGIFISIAVLKTGSPFLFLLVALILILDGGLGLLKVALLRFLKIHIFENTTMPLHDHVRKKIGWSNTQTVFRFAIIQIVISIATVYLILI